MAWPGWKGRARPGSVQTVCSGTKSCPTAHLQMLRELSRAPNGPDGQDDFAVHPMYSSHLCLSVYLCRCATQENLLKIGQISRQDKQCHMTWQSLAAIQRAGFQHPYLECFSFKDRSTALAVTLSPVWTSTDVGSLQRGIQSRPVPDLHSSAGAVSVAWPAGICRSCIPTSRTVHVYRGTFDIPAYIGLSVSTSKVGMLPSIGRCSAEVLVRGYQTIDDRQSRPLHQESLAARLRGWA